MVPLRALTAGCALLLIGAAISPARAVELNAPGVSVGVGSGGASATVGAGAADAGASAGNGGANIDANIGGAGVGVGVEPPQPPSPPVPPESLPQVPPAGDNAVDDNAGLGTDAEIISAFESLAEPEQAELRQRCSTILDNPISFTDALVTICRLIASTQP